MISIHTRRFRILLLYAVCLLPAIIWGADAALRSNKNKPFEWVPSSFKPRQEKDRRMEHYLGTTYRRYQAEVPGFPGMPFGPLTRVAWQPLPATATLPPARLSQEITATLNPSEHLDSVAWAPVEASVANRATAA
jgi:hypothetical protein